MFMSARGSQHHVAAAGQVNAFHQSQPRQQLQCAVNGHQSDFGVLLAHQVIDLDRSESVICIHQQFHNGFAWRCEPAAVLFQ